MVDGWMEFNLWLCVKIYFFIQKEEGGDENERKGDGKNVMAWKMQSIRKRWHIYTRTRVTHLFYKCVG